MASTGFGFPLSSDKEASPSTALWPFFWLFLDFSHLLPFSPFFPLFLPSLMSSIFSSARLSSIRSGISSSTASLRNSWDAQAAWGQDLARHFLAQPPQQGLVRLLWL